MDGSGVQKGWSPCGFFVFQVFAGWMGRDGTAMGCIGVLLVIRSDQGFSLRVYRYLAVYCVTGVLCTASLSSSRSMS